MLGALGVVYGDIGTSPLYALRESFHAGIHPSPSNVMGVLSLIFWSLVLVICVKYLVFIVRADHYGEGGILALSALVAGSPARRARGGKLVLTLGLFGTALLYGDGMITPAISVLSAIEGLGEATPVFEPYVIPLTIIILVVLFSGQSRGTDSVGRLFGPVTLVWFTALASLGLWHIAQQPAILASLWPGHALTFFLDNGWRGLLVLGSVFLVVTGGEALYADMGHFGRKPIRRAWFALVLPALLLNYLGQGALVLSRPETVANPFFRMLPRWGYYPMVLLAAAATVIASQALISGCYSLTMQAAQLGYLPRLRVDHTSSTEKGQVYVGLVNWVLMACCIGLVLAFRTSSNLAAAYGVAVTATMVITTLLFFYLSHYAWHWPLWKSVILCGIFLVIDLAFFGANLTKIAHGGWFPLLVGGLFFTLMQTWRSGRRMVGARLAARSMSLPQFVAELEGSPPRRVEGTAVFMSGQARVAPPALLANFRYNHVLHERVVLVTVVTSDRPWLQPGERAEIESVGPGIYRVTLNFGYMAKPDVPAALDGLMLDDRPLLGPELTYFLGRETVIAKKDLDSPMSLWRERLFALLSRNATDATAFFNIPPDQVVEMGTQIEL
ncbi:MAG: potassium transporter Kup [Vulcanimicrobiota bacterium]